MDHEQRAESTCDVQRAPSRAPRGVARMLRVPVQSTAGDRRSLGGQALAELALIAVVLALLFLGVIEIVSMYRSSGYLDDAARSGARLAALDYGDNLVINQILETLEIHGMNSSHGGQCDIQTIKIYKANDDGTQVSGPNSADTYTMQDRGAGCQAVLSGAAGWPVDQREVVQTPGSTPPNVAVEIDYSYRFQTPIFSRFGASKLLVNRMVIALGENNANNVFNLPTTTAVPTFTPTATATNTATATPTATNTATPTLTATPPNTPVPPLPSWTATATGSPTPSPTITPSPTVTQTPTPTAIPGPASVDAPSLVCSYGKLQVPTGITITWGTVPGATSYSVYYIPSGGSQSAVGTTTGTSWPASSYYTVSSIKAGDKWSVVANYADGGVSLPSYSPTVTAGQIGSGYSSCTYP